MRKPDWLKVRFRSTESSRRVKNLIHQLKLHTVCSSASCPNIGECWSRGTATFMIMGNICTRDCRFCNVPTGTPAACDPEEPDNVARAVTELGLRHAVITSVTRDDLPDGGASMFAETISKIRMLTPKTSIEILTPDFKAREQSLLTIIEAQPDIFNHNLETVRRLTPLVRSGAHYERSLYVLNFVKQHSGSIMIKSGVMMGLGESRDEILETMKDLRLAGCEVLTLGQYLQPGKHHLPVAEYIPPAEFARLEQIGMEMGFVHVFAGPLVRSSYLADRVFMH